MGCSCHGDVKNYEANVKPYDQCLMCAKKHIVQAWSAWHEFAHEMDNRDFVSAELRAAANHIKYIEKSIADDCRETAKRIEMLDDGDIASRIDALRRRITARFLEDNPNLNEKLNSYREKENADADSVRKG